MDALRLLPPKEQRPKRSRQSRITDYAVAPEQMPPEPPGNVKVETRPSYKDCDTEYFEDKAKDEIEDRGNEVDQ